MHKPSATTSAMRKSPGPGRGSEFLVALRHVFPVIVAVVPIGLLFGALAAQKGLSPAEVALMSALVFAGASQFVAIDIWTEPVPWLILTLAAASVNLRHVMMGASLVRHMGCFPARTRPFWLYFLADEVWAFSERRASCTTLTPAYYAGLAVSLYVSWVLWSTLGAVVGAALGDPADYGFDFVFTAVFIGLIAGFWRGYATGIVIGASIAGAILGKLFVPGPWYIMIGGLAGTLTGAFFCSVAPTGDKAP